MLAIKSVAGPNPYAAGGFTVQFTQFQKVNFAMVKCDLDDVLAVADTAYAVGISFSGNTVTIKVYSASTVGAGPNAWAELAAGNMSARTFTVIADGV